MVGPALLPQPLPLPSLLAVITHSLTSLSRTVSRGSRPGRLLKFYPFAIKAHRAAITSNTVISKEAITGSFKEKKYGSGKGMEDEGSQKPVLSECCLNETRPQTTGLGSESQDHHSYGSGFVDELPLGAISPHLTYILISHSTQPFRCHADLQEDQPWEIRRRTVFCYGPFGRPNVLRR